MKLRDLMSDDQEYELFVECLDDLDKWTRDEELAPDEYSCYPMPCLTFSGVMVMIDILKAAMERDA